MNSFQFVFNGGLGNQIFQYLASEYISDKFKNSKINYALSNYILNGGRDFELNKILKSPLHISKEYNQYFEKIYTKLIYNCFFLNDSYKDKITFFFNLINSIYYEKKIIDNLENPVQELSNDLQLIAKIFSKLKIKGYWQNPSCYLEKLESYANYFIDTKKFLPESVKPNGYIAIHIRRGDYLLNKQSIKDYYSKFSPIQFILQSLKLLPNDCSNLPIYLVSDDKKWKLYLIDIISDSLNTKIYSINTSNHFEDWSIIRHASINICSNSTFSYSAALLNNENKSNKLRCIVPQWIDNETTSFEKGWLNPNGFIGI